MTTQYPSNKDIALLVDFIRNNVNRKRFTARFNEMFSQYYILLNQITTQKYRLSYKSNRFEIPAKTRILAIMIRGSNRYLFIIIRNQDTIIIANMSRYLYTERHEIALYHSDSSFSKRSKHIPAILGFEHSLDNRHSNSKKHPAQVLATIMDHLTFHSALEYFGYIITKIPNLCRFKVVP